MAMRGIQRLGVCKLSCLGHRPPPFNLHFIIVTSAVGPKSPDTLSRSQRLLALIYEAIDTERSPCQYSGIVSCGTSQRGEAAASQTKPCSFSRGDQRFRCHLVHGPSTPRALPHGPTLYSDTGGNGKQNTLWRLVGIHLPLL